MVLEEAAILPRMGARERRPESDSLAAALAPHRELVRLDDPPDATLDGGDVLHVGDTLYVGWSGRTNHAGLRAFAHLVLPYGYKVKAVEVRGCLHLKTACTWLGDELLLVNPRWVRLGRVRGLRALAVDPAEPFAANALRVGDTVLLQASCPRTAERVAAAGYDVRTLDISEFARAEAGLTCLSLILD